MGRSHIQMPTSASHCAVEAYIKQFRILSQQDVRFASIRKIRTDMRYHAISWPIVKAEDARDLSDSWRLPRCQGGDRREALLATTCESNPEQDGKVDSALA
jgi:hypothetical protein